MVRNKKKAEPGFEGRSETKVGGAYKYLSLARNGLTGKLLVGPMTRFLQGETREQGFGPLIYRFDFGQRHDWHFSGLLC